MRWFILTSLAALAVGCGKRPEPTAAPSRPGPSDAAFAGDNPDNTLAWLAAQRSALNAVGDAEAAERFKAVAESMKGRAIDWPGKLAQAEPDNTGTLLAWTLDADPPGPRGEERREWHYAMVCRPFDPAAYIADDAPLVRRPEVGFPLAAGDWRSSVKPGTPARLAGTVAAVQLHRRSWVTGYGIQDRIVHTEIGVTLHIAGGTVSPP